MKTKDRCDNCSSTNSVSYWDYKDGSILCENCYRKLGEEWEKMKIKTTTLEKNNNKLYGIHGLLGLFRAGLIFSLIYNFIIFFFEIGSIIEQPILLPDKILILMPTTIILLVFVGFNIFTLICLNKLKPNAVSVAKKYVILVFLFNLYNVILIITTLPASAENVSEMARYLLRMLFGVMWFLYFIFSKRVANTWSKSERKSTLTENIWFYSLLVIGIISMALLYYSS
ncbi:MAG: hypothetical protein Q7K43_03210 [Candidatus Woesearchaeota archaeon]|nr:hypothetical protein [Candidatus Woesearchaeota archaeon]